jgi:hypothetical protein
MYLAEDYEIYMAVVRVIKKEKDSFQQQWQRKAMELFSCILCLKLCEAFVQFIKTLVMTQNVMKLPAFCKQMRKKKITYLLCRIPN